MSHHSLINFEIKKIIKININLVVPKINDGAYVIDLDEYKSIRIIKYKSIITNIYRIQTYDLIMCGYFCIRFIDFMRKSKSLLDFTNLVSPNKYEKNDKIILKYFH